MNTQSDSTKVTFTQVYQDVKGTLTALGEALKVGAEHVYEVLVKQQLVYSISMVILYVALGVTAFFLFKHTPKWITKCQENDDCEPWWLLWIIPGLVGISLVVILCSTIVETITGFVNPEYGAMKEIMEFVK